MNRININKLVLIILSYILIIASDISSSEKIPSGVSFTAKPTILFINENNISKQVLEVKVGSALCLSAQLEGYIGGRVFNFGKLSIKKGINTFFIPIQEVSSEVNAILALEMNGKKYEAQVIIKPQKKWTVFIAASVHTDIGFTDIQSLVFKKHSQNIDMVIDKCLLDQAFKWNLEVAWQARDYIDNHTEQKNNRFIDLMRDGRIGVQALYLNMLTGLCSSEELNRLCYYSERLRRVYKIPVRSAALTDIPTYAWSLPSMLKGSGIDYFVGGIHSDRTAFFLFTDMKSPFWWQGPDGSKILCWFSDSYAQVKKIGLLENREKVYSNLSEYILKYDKGSYPFDAVLLYGAFYDNETINTKFADEISSWNSRWAYPKLVLTTTDTFFDYIKKSPNIYKIPVYSGDGGAYWEDGAASSSRETSFNRHAKEDIISAEKLSSFASMMDPQRKYPSDKLSAIWDNIFFYDEHTWGADCSISRPGSKMTKNQWKVKSGYINKAKRELRDVLNTAADYYFTNTDTTNNKCLISILNTSGFSRDAFVKTEIPSFIFKNYKSFNLIDRSSQRNVPYAIIGGKEICFIAQSLPPIGYKTYEVAADSPSGIIKRKSISFFDYGMENSFYRIEVDKNTGAIISIYDKELKKDILDRTSIYKLNQYIYISPKRFYNLAMPANGKAKLVFKEEKPQMLSIEYKENNPVFGSLVVSSRSINTPLIKSTYTIYSDVKRIDIRNDIIKKNIFSKESIFISFPFIFQKPDFVIDIPNGFVRPGADQLKGACKNWYAVQHFVNLTEGNEFITLSTPDAPIVSFSEINLGRWIDVLKIKNGTVFSYIMNNLWHTNYKASQGGKFVFKYSLTSGFKNGQLNLNALHFSLSDSNPVIARFVEPGRKGRFLKMSESFCQMDKPNVEILAVKKAEYENGYIIRFFETEGKNTEAALFLPNIRFKEVWLCNLVEAKQKQLKYEGSKIIVPVTGSSVVTIMLKEPLN